MSRGQRGAGDGVKGRRLREVVVGMQVRCCIILLAGIVLVIMVTLMVAVLPGSAIPSATYRTEMLYLQCGASPRESPQDARPETTALAARPKATGTHWRRLQLDFVGR